MNFSAKKSIPDEEIETTALMALYFDDASRMGLVVQLCEKHSIYGTTVRLEVYSAVVEKIIRLRQEAANK